MQEIERMITPRQAAEAEGRGITTIYKRLARDEYDAVKDGKSTLILWPLSTEEFFSTLAARRPRGKDVDTTQRVLGRGQFEQIRAVRSAPRKEEGGKETRRAVRLASDGPS
jgi:hypothetical protein